MKCSKCNQNKANVSVLTTVNGATEKAYLCEKCAQELEYKNLFMLKHGLNFDNILSSMFSEKIKAQKAQRCGKCGTTLSDMANSGAAGCAQCYQTFYRELIPTIHKLHGNTKHRGKLAAHAGAKIKLNRQREELRCKLKKAIELQEFEEAALLRDRLKALGEGMQNG